MATSVRGELEAEAAVHLRGSSSVLPASKRKDVLGRLFGSTREGAHGAVAEIVVARLLVDLGFTLEEGVVDGGTPDFRAMKQEEDWMVEVTTLNPSKTRLREARRIHDLVEAVDRARPFTNPPLGTALSLHVWSAGQRSLPASLFARVHSWLEEVVTSPTFRELDANTRSRNLPTLVLRESLEGRLEWEEVHAGGAPSWRFGATSDRMDGRWGIALEVVALPEISSEHAGRVVFWGKAVGEALPPSRLAAAIKEKARAYGNKVSESQAFVVFVANDEWLAQSQQERSALEAVFNGTISAGLAQVADGWDLIGYEYADDGLWTLSTVRPVDAVVVLDSRGWRTGTVLPIGLATNPKSRFAGSIRRILDEVPTLDRPRLSS